MFRILEGLTKEKRIMVGSKVTRKLGARFLDLKMDLAKWVRAGMDKEETNFLIQASAAKG